MKPGRMLPAICIAAGFLLNGCATWPPSFLAPQVNSIDQPDPEPSSSEKAASATTKREEPLYIE